MFLRLFESFWKRSESERIKTVDLATFKHDLDCRFVNTTRLLRTSQVSIIINSSFHLPLIINSPPACVAGVQRGGGGGVECEREARSLGSRSLRDPNDRASR